MRIWTMVVLGMLLLMSASTTAHAVTQTQISQSFGIGGGTYSSNVNYFINANGALIQGLVATMALTGPLVGTATEDSGNWSLQANTYAPVGTRAAYNQYVIVCDYISGTKQLQIYSQDYFIQNNDLVMLWNYGGFQTFPQAIFTAGVVVSITLTTNSTGAVTSSTQAITAANGTKIYSYTIPITVFDYNGVTGDAQTPLVGLEMQLIGDGNFDHSTFTQASGTFNYYSTTGLQVLSTPSLVPWVQYNALSGDGQSQGTGETSNIAYGMPNSQVISTTTSSSTTSKTSTATSTSTSKSTSTSTTTSTTSTMQSSSQTVVTITSTSTVNVNPATKEGFVRKDGGYVGAGAVAFVAAVSCYAVLRTKPSAHRSGTSKRKKTRRSKR